MFTSILFTTVLASSVARISQAIVVPNTPGPGDSFDQGTNCHIGWGGDDTGSTTAWKNMAIELMTGPNEAMIHVTTVAQGQDGTAAGVFDYTCPEVTPNSPIYFYQFTAPATTNITWTTRFTIAAADGSSTPATETEKSSTGEDVAWGKGALVDPSTAVAAPNFGATGSSSTGGSSSAGGSNSTTNPTGSGSGSSGGLSTAAAQTKASTAGSPTHSASTPNNSGNSTGAAGAAQQSGTSAAMPGAMALDTRMWPVVAAMTVSALSFTLLL
ncbi:hypothetical protein B0H17DRAFT_916268 [Mycena rosella]|uniref:Yeast cell wall synthesis Kre9/Knh1-like N-terminal domain-containing protein n=1 Tax=Mycena rosella TaxID=1033263 RepID=A0AAD7GZW5_MYCRO|nr:hypothetical protein B0H17DRAFT_916268 [Mycena rosella]